MHSLHELFTRAIGGIWFRKSDNGWRYTFYKFYEAYAVNGAEFIYGFGNEDASNCTQLSFITLEKFTEMRDWEEVKDEETLRNLTAAEAKKVIEVSMV
jgi:hypothetical protein